MSKCSVVSAFHFLSRHHDAESFNSIWPTIEHEVVFMIYGSNLIESAGAGFLETAALCQAVFRGQEIFNITGTNEQKKRWYEVINHARALKYMINEVVCKNGNITESLILTIHAMLFDNMEIEEEGLVPGQYRVDEVAVRYAENKKARCMRASAVPKYMASLVSHLRGDIKRADNYTIDPYTLAARYHHQFAMIHPFLDGNGRIARILLNILLLKHAGHLVAFGLNDHEKAEYLDRVRQDAKMFHQEDMVVEFPYQKFHVEFAGLVLRKSIMGYTEMLRGIHE